MNTILQTLLNPAKAFQELKQQENKFPGGALIILLLLLTVVFVLMVPVMAKVMTVTVSSVQMPEKQMDSALSVMHKLRYLVVIGQLFTAAITLFLYALLLYILTLIAKPALTYVKSLTLVVYSYFVCVIGSLTDAGLLYAKGLEEIKSPYETVLTGLNVFTSVEKSGATLFTFLSMINPFQVWFVILLSIGLKIFAEIKYAKALIICVIFWLLTVIYPVVSVFFSEAMLKRSGIM